MHKHTQRSDFNLANHVQKIEIHMWFQGSTSPFYSNENINRSLIYWPKRSVVSGPSKRVSLSSKREHESKIIPNGNC